MEKVNEKQARSEQNKDAEREPPDDLTKEFIRLYGHPQLWWFKR